MRIPVRLLIGNPSQEFRDSSFEFIPSQYHTNVEALFTQLRDLIGGKPATLATCFALHCVALQAMHRAGEIELSVWRCIDGQETRFHVDVKGDFIEPWPDEFFELTFYCLFPSARE